MQLIRKDNNNRIRVVEIVIQQEHDFMTINRRTGLLGGTMTEQPAIEIFSGKVNRTMEEQAILEYNSMVSDYKDKGYKEVTEYGVRTAEMLTQQIIHKILMEKLCDTKGVPKHMLAKLAPNKYDRKYNKLWFGSYKIDGVRCSLHYNPNTQSIFTASRGGKSFKDTTKHITQNPVLLQLFETYPDLVLDGELYIHGRPLAFISGLSRLKYYDPEIHEKLDYYVFDVIADTEFRERLKTLRNIEQVLHENAMLSGDLSICDTIRFVQHEECYNYADVEEMHNRAIEEGFEGLVLRDPDEKYGYGTRDWRMIKVKMFDDDEFTIKGMTPGLREEDMVFVMQARNGKTFEAKPVGSRSLREHYFHNIDKYIGKKGTVKYFGYTPYGIPNLPVFKYVRNE